MRLRAFLAAVVTAFERPALSDAQALAAPVARVQEQDGIVSEASAFRIRTAFERFARFVSGGG